MTRLDHRARSSIGERRAARPQSRQERGSVRKKTSLGVFAAWRLSLCLSALSALLPGCPSCGHKPPLAELASLTGSVTRDFADHVGTWSPAAPGAAFAVGDGLHTDKGAQAELRLRGGGTLDVRPDTVLRFLASAPSAQRRVSLETGTAEIEMGDQGVEFETRFGTAKIDPGAHVRLTDDGTLTRFDVIVGSAVLESPDASAESLRAGQSVDLGARAAPDAGPPSLPDAAAPMDAAADDPDAIVADIAAPGVQRGASRSSPLVPAPPGAARLEPGSRLVVPAGARVVVHRGAERATISGAADLVVGGASGALLEARSGRVSVDTSPTLIRLNVPGGTITVRGTVSVPASADVVVDARETDVFSRAGTTELHGRRSVKTLTGRESAWLEEGGAAEKSIVTSEPPQFTLPAGESATVHATQVPTPVRVRVDPACGAGAYVEVARAGRFMPVGLAEANEDGAQERAVVLSLGEGSHTYRVRCPEQAGAGSNGSVRILHDSGAARLPRTAGRNALHADGRRYSVLYQNLLPELTLDWPDAPAGEPLTLKLRESKDKVDEIPVADPTYSLPSGKLGDGTYGFWFEVARDPRLRSLETTVRIAFDNAAPAAEIHEPDDGFAPKDGKVLVSGVAVEGVHVSVGDTDIPLDAQYRFRGEVPVSPGDRSIAIRIAHPTRGVHYYLRRIGGS